MDTIAIITFAAGLTLGLYATLIYNIIVIPAALKLRGRPEGYNLQPDWILEAEDLQRRKLAREALQDFQIEETAAPLEIDRFPDCQKDFDDFQRVKPVETDDITHGESKEIVETVEHVADGSEANWGVSEFIKEIQENGQSGWQPLIKLRPQYDAFCDAHGHDQAGPRRFGIMLGEAGCRADSRETRTPSGVRERRRIWYIPPPNKMQKAA